MPARIWIQSSNRSRETSLSSAQETVKHPLNPLFILGFCLLVSFSLLLISTKSSPLYPLNDWGDANAYFTMGKGMMNGKVLYRDLFEQKGPLLYFIHGLSYLISSRSFLGVFIFETFSFSFFLFFSYKLISLFFEPKYALIWLPIIAVVILNLKSFTHGDSAEEFCLPFLAFSLYSLFDYFKNVYPRPISDKWVFWNGVVAGCVLWIKFSLLGFWFGWIVSICICLLVNKQTFLAIKKSLLFLSGMAAATLPWLGYFGISHAIPEWINTYLLVNVTDYPNNLSVLPLFHFILSVILFQVKENPIFNVCLGLGIIFFMLSNKIIKSLLHRILLLFCFLSLFLGIYAGGRGFIYYYLILAPFLLLGILVLQDAINTEFKKGIPAKTAEIIALVIFILTLPLNTWLNQNSYMLSWKKQEMVQYKFASIIDRSKNPTLLNYGSLDIGLYTTTGIIPNTRFFEGQNIDPSRFPMVVEAQNQYIKNKAIEYIVIMLPPSETLESQQIPFLLDNYKLLDSERQNFENTDFSYFLLKRID